MSVANGEVVVFLTGSEMWPDRVNAAWPGARFVARGAVLGEGLEAPAPFDSLLGSEIWGVLVTTAGATPGPESIVIRADDGRLFEAIIENGTLLQGDPEDVIAAARYWELPYQYVARLREALAAAGTVIEDEEPRDDAVTG